MFLPIHDAKVTTNVIYLITVNSLADYQASAKNEAIGEGKIEKYDEINPNHKAFEDIDEVQSTDDV